MDENTAPNPTEAASEAPAELDAGNYEVIRKRLEEQSKQLGGKLDGLNARRKDTFGGTEMEVISNERIRTENNCVPRDMVRVGKHFLFGYNVFIGLRSETAVHDVFSVQSLTVSDDGFEFSELGLDQPAATFLSDRGFQKDFQELYRYGKNVHFMQFRRTETKLLAIFSVGDAVSDVKILRWGVGPRGELRYIDQRGDEDHVYPNQHDFEWLRTDRAQQVTGTHPHIGIDDRIFVETIGGTFTIKVENNTDSGHGIYAEKVEDENQSLDDAEIYYALVGTLILLKVKPFREEEFRFFIYNGRTEQVHRIDSMGQSCLQLPEDHGVIFPDGFHLQAGDTRVFEGNFDDLIFEKAYRSPNGEDVLYTYHRPADGHYVLIAYNLIRKAVAQPIHCHGYSMLDNGNLIVFRALSDEPTRVHPVQIWATSFTSAEFAASEPTDGSYLAKVGNAELVRGISELYSVKRMAAQAEPTRVVFEDLVGSSTRVLDNYYWLAHKEVGEIRPLVEEIRKTAELIIDEFEKVQAIRSRARAALAEASQKQLELHRDLRPDHWDRIEPFMNAMRELRTERGQIISLREMRYIDLAAIDKLEEESVERFDDVSAKAVEFLLKGEALLPLTGKLDELLAQIQEVKLGTELAPLEEELERTSEGLDVLSEVIAGLQVDDAQARTQILEDISEVFSHLNRVRAIFANRRKEVLAKEGRAEFGAQFKLFGQNVASVLAMADSPERCDEQLSRLLVQLEELEGRFGEFDEFLGDLASKREEVYEALGARKQALLDERQRRAGNLMGAAERILSGVGRRARAFKTPDELNAYFASDAMVLKLRQISEQLGEIGDSVRADEVLSRLKSAKQDGLRALWDKLDLFEDGENVIKLGRHRFSVNTQQLELTLVPRDGDMALHLSGTDFFGPVTDEDFLGLKAHWDQQYVSENKDVYRGEYLAAQVLLAAEAGEAGLSMSRLSVAQMSQAGLLKVVREYCSSRYDEGYERGLHDADGAAILDRLLTVRQSAGLLRFASEPRGWACLYWGALGTEEDKETLRRKAQSLQRLEQTFGLSQGKSLLAAEIRLALRQGFEKAGAEVPPQDLELASQYLTEELGAAELRFTTSNEAETIRDALLRYLDHRGDRRAFEDDRRLLEEKPLALAQLCLQWIKGFLTRHQDEEPWPHLGHAAWEAAVLLATERSLARASSAALSRVKVEGLLGQHPRISEQAMELRLDEFLARVGHFYRHTTKEFRRYRQVRQSLLESERDRLRLDEFKPRVLSSFVRNRLINEVYLPMVGDNLAKQMGALGDKKRTDLMGMLLLISPPGYGKTTLMEYVASRLGLVFMKVNGPSLGHNVVSLDPSEAGNATAAQEVEKINLAFEMGNNVMLYLDDIQHTSPELLQKFISLCDGQRRIEGVWRGITRTYDLRGKKFCVIMAGNPYTETGEKFQIPDMLANRADTYNLGDVLSGREAVFGLSYLENALTSNPVLQPLSTREPKDVQLLLRMAQGEEVPTTDLSYGYSAAEVSEIIGVMQKLLLVQEVLLAVNQQYIASAAQSDEFRTEPPFKLQGSYRNMNKLAEKVVAAMNADELQSLIDDHYAGEAQTLTNGAEENILKLNELRGRLTEEQAARWQEICSNYARIKSMGGAEDDPVVRVTGTLATIGQQLERLYQAVGAAAKASQNRPDSLQRLEQKLSPVMASALPELQKLQSAVGALQKPQLEVLVHTETTNPDLTELILRQVNIVENSLVPLLAQVTRNAGESQALQARMLELGEMLKIVDARMQSNTRIEMLEEGD